MLKRLFSGVSLTFLLLLGLPTVASAHVLKVDGHVGAVLHINPDDNPTTGKPTDYVLSFNDDTGKFSLSKCNCTVSIIQNGTSVATKPLAISSSEMSENHYTYIKPDVYTMRITGQPKQAGAFQSFTLNYEVRVTSGSATTQPFPVMLWVGMGMGIGLILLAAVAMDYDSDKAINRDKQ
jgi:hypothetical protein